MKRRKEYTWIIATIGISVLLLFQLVLVSRLYQLKKEYFLQKSYESLENGILQLNVDLVKNRKYAKNFIAYDYISHKVMVVINGVKYLFIDKESTEKEILERTYYDVSNTRWTASQLDSLVRDSMDEYYCRVPLKIVIRDSLGRSIDEAGNLDNTPIRRLRFGPVPLGYVTGRTLEAYYYFPFINFLYHEADRIIMTVALFILLVFFICFLIQTIRVERKMANAREEFMHIVVHNLQSPVDFVRRITYEIRNRARQPYNEEQERLYNEVKERLDMMGGGIRRLLTHSVGLYGMHLEKSGINLREMIERVVIQYKMISGKEINMECDLDEIELIADPVHLSGAVANLVENAVKYTGDDASIRVKCEVRGKYIQIVVTDNGPGIPDKEINRIFRKYYRASSGLKGFGLGLNYVWKVVAAHRGKITVRNAEGCEFTIILPWKKG